MNYSRHAGWSRNTFGYLPIFFMEMYGRFHHFSFSFNAIFVQWPYLHVSLSNVRCYSDMTCRFTGCSQLRNIVGIWKRPRGIKTSRVGARENTHIHPRAHITTYKCIWSHTHLCACVSLSLSLYIYIYIYIYICVCVCVCVCVYIYIHIYDMHSFT